MKKNTILIISLIIVLSIFLPFSAIDAENMSKNEISVSIENYINKNIIQRFNFFKDKVHLSGIEWKNPVYVVKGELTADNGKPMDMVGKFTQTLDDSKKFKFVMPQRIKKIDEDNQNKVSFELRLLPDLEKIPKDISKMNSFNFVVPSSIVSPAEVKISINDKNGTREIYKNVHKGSTQIKLEFETTGSSTMVIELDSVVYRKINLK